MGIKGFGETVSKIKDVKRDKTGSVVMDTRISGHTFTATATLQSTTTKTTGITPERYFLEMPWSNPRGSGADIALIHNGATVASVINQAEGASGTLTATLDTPPATPQTLTGRFSWASPGTAQSPGTTTTTATGVGITRKHAFTGLVASGFLSFTIAKGTADVALLRNGSVMTSVAGQTGANTISYSLTAETTSPTLTARFTWANLATITTTFQTGASITTNGTSNSTASSQVLSGEGSLIRVTAHVGSDYGTITYLVNGGAFYTNTAVNATSAYTSTTTGTFTSPSVTVRAHAPGGNNIQIMTRTYYMEEIVGSAPNTLRIKGFGGSASIGVNQIRTKALG